MATTLRGLELLSPLLVQYIPVASVTSTTPITLLRNRHILVQWFSLYVFHLTIGPHVWIQFLLTLPTFRVMFILSLTPLLPRFYLVLSSILSTEFEPM